MAFSFLCVKKTFFTLVCLSLGRVFQFHVLCRLQASFRDMGQNSTFRRPVDSAMCGPEPKQSLVLKNACKEPPSGFKGPPASNFAGLRLANQHLQASEAFWQLAALPSRFSSYSQATPSCSQAHKSLPSISQAHKSLPSNSQAHKALPSSSQATS